MTTSRSRGGRPRKSEGPRVPYEEVDRLLVFGEVLPCEDGSGSTQVVFPSYRDLGERYGVSHSVIAEYAKTHNIQRRRKEAQSRIQAKTEQKLVEQRATALALSKDDELRIIDRYLVGFEQALDEGRVRFDNPADFNTMLRLKEFTKGNADSRAEVHASLSLESLQARHRQMMRTVEATPEERGETVAALAPARSSPTVQHPPASRPREAPQEPSARPAIPTTEAARSVVAPTVARLPSMAAVPAAHAVALTAQPSLSSACAPGPSLCVLDRLAMSSAAGAEERVPATQPSRRETDPMADTLRPSDVGG
jgi:hypothetical protein